MSLAFKNVKESGLRGWLNVFALSFAFAINVFLMALMSGWEQQAVTNSIAWEYAEGQYVINSYDKEDPFTIQQSHGTYSPAPDLTPVLLRQGTIYPNNRMVNLVMKGIDPNQKTVKIPTGALRNSSAEFPVVIGSSMAQNNGLSVGDQFTIRWKDVNGTYDATQATVVEIFNTFVPSVDLGQVWMSIDQLQSMTDLKGEATYLLASEKNTSHDIENFHFESQDDLLASLRNMLETERGGQFFLTMVLYVIALLAVFDTQVFSIFKRQKEIGTFNALGMNKNSVKWMFTIEGTLFSVLGVIFGLIWATPIFYYTATHGISYGEVGGDLGVVIPDVMYPLYQFETISKTAIVLILISVVVCYFPVKKISTMNTVDALKGRKI